MGYKIVKKRVLGPDSKMFVIEAPYVPETLSPDSLSSCA